MGTAKKKKRKLLWIVVVVSILFVLPKSGEKEATSSAADTFSSAVDTFYSLYNASAKYGVSELAEMDIQGDDYRHEFRLSAFSSADGKKGTVDGGVFEAVNYGNMGKTQFRIYATVDSKETAVQIVYDVIHIFDSSISDAKIRSEVEKDDIRFVFGSQIQGYVLRTATTDPISGYKVFVDCSNINFAKSK